jgi:hypothetical protein
VLTTCNDFTLRAEADGAMAARRPREAAAAHRQWIEQVEPVVRDRGAREDVFEAYTLAEHYRLLREALMAAGDAAAAAEPERRRREVIAYWKSVPAEVWGER